MVQPYYERDGIMLYHGRCEDVLPSLPAESVDMVFTSPPYNLGNTTGSSGHPDRFGHYRKSTGLAGRGGSDKRRQGGPVYGYGQHDDSMPHEAYVEWQHTILRECWRLLSPTGAIYYNHKPRILDGQLISPFAYLPSDLLPFVRQVVIWKRSGGINFTNTAYLPMHEWIVIIARRAFRLRDKGASGVGDVWTVHQERNNPHPAPFPVGLPMRAIETTPAALVLDPFAGSGTTLVAAQALGRRAVGIELEERFCEMTTARLAQSPLSLGVAL